MYVVPFSYMYCGRVLQRLEVLAELDPRANNQRLVDLRYIKKLTPAQERDVRKCDGCGKLFFNTEAVYAHRKLNLCGATPAEVLQKDRRTDREVIENLPPTLRDALSDKSGKYAEDET